MDNEEQSSIIHSFSRESWQFNAVNKPFSGWSLVEHILCEHQFEAIPGIPPPSQLLVHGSFQPVSTNQGCY